MNEDNSKSGGLGDPAENNSSSGTKIDVITPSDQGGNDTQPDQTNADSGDASLSGEATADVNTQTEATESTPNGANAENDGVDEQKDSFDMDGGPGSEEQPANHEAMGSEAGQTSNSDSETAADLGSAGDGQTGISSPESTGAETTPAPESTGDSQPPTESTESSPSSANNPSNLSEALAGLPDENKDQSNTGMVSGSAGAPVSLTADHPEKTKRKKRWLWPVIILVIIIILAALWFFFMYLPSRPSAVYSSSLSRTGLAVDKLIDYTKTSSPSDHQSFKVTGSAKINGKNFDFSSGLTGDYDKNGNTTTSLNVDDKTEGNQNQHVKLGFDLRTLKDAANSYPDIYFKLTGLDSLLSAFGATSDPYSSLDGKWIVIKHELIKQYADQYAGEATGDSQLKEPTKAQIYDAIDKVQAVNKKYLFTDDSQTAVLVKKKYIGAETKYGRSVYHYKVGYNKNHLIAYTDAVAAALNSSQLNDWSKQTLKHDLVQTDDLKSAKDDISKNFDANYTFDLWADRDTKLIEAVMFSDKDNKNTVTIAQTYSGGHTYPFKVVVAGDDNGDSGSLVMDLTVNGDNDQVNFDFNFNDNDHGNKTTASGNFTISPSSGHSQVEKPASAEPLQQVLQNLGLGSASTSAPATQPLSGLSGSAQEAEVKSNLAEAKEKLVMYNVAGTGSYPANLDAFIGWLESPAGGNSNDFAAQLQSGKYKYVASPKNCDGKKVKCTSFTLTANKSMWGGSKDITVED